jgi:hypothetical protein
MKKRAYRATTVKQIQAADVVRALAPGQVWVGIDVAKEELLVVMRDRSGEHQRPWKVKQPGELGTLVGLLLDVHRQRPLIVALESTGTYGDALRQVLTEPGAGATGAARQVQLRPIFDGVPSTHDGKDAAISELAAIARSPGR